MSSFNNIQKIKYSKDPDAVVSLEEYIIFEDERAEEKFVVFKFSNNINQQLLGMEFEVTQYDIDGEVVEKSVVIYNKFLSKPNKSFVPNAKLKINYLAKSVSVRLIKAAFDRFLWHEGEFLDNSYKFEHYAKDRDYDLLKPAVKAAAPVQAKAQPAKRKKYIPFKVKNSTRKNIAKFPGVFNAFVCLIVFVAIGLSLYFFQKDATVFTLNGYDLKIISGDNVAVCGYNGDEENLSFPETIDKYTVTQINSGAFKDSKIKRVSFSSASLVIESGAFENCTLLTAVGYSDKAVSVSVKDNAFKNCTALSLINMPKAYLYENSFTGCTGVTYLSFYETSAKTLNALFGGKAPSGLKEGYVVSATPLPENFFSDNVQGGDDKPDDGDKPSADDKYDPEKTYLYGEIEKFNLDGYIKTESYEAVDGEILTVNTEKDTFTLGEGVTEVNVNLADTLTKMSVLNVNADVGNNIYSYFTNVHTVYVSDAVTKIEYGAFEKMPYLESLNVPYYNPVRIVEMFGNFNNLKNLTVRPTAANKVIPMNAFNDLNDIEGITVEEGFTYCRPYIISDSPTLRSITLPAMTYYNTGATIGLGCTNLTNVNVAFKGVAPAKYSDFNESYSSTENLSLTCENLDTYGFLEGINRFEYLDLNFTVSQSYNLSDLFGSYDVTITKLTLNCPVPIENEIFLGGIDPENITDFINNSIS